MSDDNKTIFKKGDTMIYSIYELEKRSFIDHLVMLGIDNFTTQEFFVNLRENPLYQYVLLKFRRGKSKLDKNDKKALVAWSKVLYDEIKRQIRLDDPKYIVFICQTCNKDMDYCECPACCVDCGKIHPFEECEQEEEEDNLFCKDCEGKMDGLCRKSNDCYCDYCCECGEKLTDKDDKEMDGQMVCNDCYIA
jgi:hypothetical protein